MNKGVFKMSKTQTILLVSLLVVVVIGLSYSLLGFSKNSKYSKDSNPSIKESSAKTSPITSQSADSKQKFDTKSRNSKVSIELTPSKFENGELIVDFSINTHSVDLSQYDLKEIVVLDIDGETFKPVSAPKMSGHHNSGELVFNVPESLRSNAFKIIVSDLPNIDKRVLEWP